MLFRVENCNYSYICLGDLCCPFQLSQPLQSCTLGVATSPWCFRRFLPCQFTAAIWGPLFPALVPCLHDPQGSELAPSFLLFSFSKHQDFAEHFNPYHWGRLGNRFICKTWHTSYGEIVERIFFKK